MSLHDEIARAAHELYEKSGRIHGRDIENWLEAERIILGGNVKEMSLEAALDEKKKTAAKKQTAKAGPKKEVTKKTAAVKKTKAVRAKKT